MSEVFPAGVVEGNVCAVVVLKQRPVLLFYLIVNESSAVHLDLVLCCIHESLFLSRVHRNPHLLPFDPQV